MHNVPQSLMPPEQYRDMAKQIVSNAAGFHEFLNACEGCGLPVEQQRADLNAQVDFAKGFLKHFFNDDAS